MRTRTPAALAVVLGLAVLPVPVAAAEKLNVVWFVGEDMGPELGCYGSPVVDKTRPNITKAVVGKDGKSVRLYVDKLQEGHIHELHAPGVRSAEGLPLLHPEAYYTLNYVPAK